jgi:hypothetical protein
LHWICLLESFREDLVIDWLWSNIFCVGIAIFSFITLWNIMSLVLSRRSCRVYQFLVFNISDTLLVLWCLLHVYLAARRCTFSSEFMFSFVWGSQTVQQYSNLGLITVWYARSFIVCDCTFRFLLIKHNDLFTLVAVCWMWVFHFRSVEIVTPRYFACWTDSNIWPCML